MEESKKNCIQNCNSVEAVCSNLNENLIFCECIIYKYKDRFQAHLYTPKAVGCETDPNQ